MDWLKDKKNLPIVVGMGIFVLLAAGGLIAFELGVFPGSTTRTAVAPSGPPAPAPPPPGASPMPMSAPQPPGPRLPGTSAASAPGAKPAAASAVLNPKVGPDPFNIPGGQKILASRSVPGNTNGASGAPMALRDILPKFDLFSIPASAAPPMPVPTGPAPPGVLPANMKFIGTVNSSGGIYAILESSGQSQPVKPGDSLPDGTQVVSIQPTGVTIRTATGTTATIPLSNGTLPAPAPAPDQMNGQPYNQNNGGQGQPGQPFDPMAPPGFPGQ